jgi:hypothetical protein
VASEKCSSEKENLLFIITCLGGKVVVENDICSHFVYCDTISVEYEKFLQIADKPFIPSTWLKDCFCKN